MCGRFTSTTTDPDKLQQTFSVDEIRLDAPLAPRYNVAPTQNILTVVADDSEKRYLGQMRWGFLPAWHKDTSKLGGQINARGETAAEKPMFRAAFKKRRCLIIADGFYEWHVNEDGTKTPMYIFMEDKNPFGMAGLWERWTHPETGEGLVTCTILTTDANTTMQPIHHRMPVILQRDDYALWLNPNVSDQEELQALIKPFPDAPMRNYAVSTRVNNARNDDPTLIEKAS